LYPSINPITFGQLTIDQVILLACDPKYLTKYSTSPITASPEDLASQGIKVERDETVPPGSSFVEQWRLRQAKEEAANLKRTKRERRKQKIKDMAEYKRQRGDI